MTEKFTDLIIRGIEDKAGELNTDIELIETKNERRFPYNFNVGDTIILDFDIFIIESEDEFSDFLESVEVMDKLCEGNSKEGE